MIFCFRNNLFWFLFLLLGSLLQAQPLKWKEIKESDGFISNYIYDIEEDEKGHLWIGTAQGLIRYDGFRSKVFQDLEDSIQNYPVYNIHKINDEQFWLGTAKGLKTFQLKTKKISTPFPEITAHVEDIISLSDGYFLVSELKKVFKIDINNNGEPISKRSLDFSYFKKNDSPEFIINEFFVDSNGYLYISLFGFGVIKGKVSEIGNWEKFNIISPGKGNFSRCLSMKKYGDNIIIFNFSGEGIYQYEDKKNYFTEIRGFHRKDGKYTDVTALNVISDQIIASKMTYGLFTKPLTGNKNNLKEISFANLPDFNLVDNHISTIHISSNIIFLGTLGDGIKYAELDNPGIKTYSLAHKIGPRTPIFTLGHHNGFIYAGTSGEGIIRMEINEKKELAAATYWKDLHGNHLSTDSIAEIHFSKDNTMWIATANGLNYIETDKSKNLGKNKSITPKIFSNTGALGSLSSNVVNDIFEYKDGSIYLATQTGLNKFNPDTESFTNHQNSIDILYSKKAPIFYADYLAPSVFLLNSLQVNDIIDGEVISSYHSLFKQKGTIIFHSTRQNEQTAWFGTNRGLFKYDLKTRKIVPFINESFFKNIKINTIKLVNNKLWMGTSKGIMYYDVKNNTYDQFDVPQAKGWPFFHYGAICTDDEENIYFGTNRGIVQVNPQKINSRKAKNNTNKIYANSVKNISKSTLIPFSEKEDIEIAQNDIVEIELALSVHFLLENNQLEYTFDNKSPKWIPIDKTDPKIFIHQMTAGRYECKIRVNGNQNIADLSLRIEVLKPVWLSNKAIVFYVLTVLVIMAVYFRYTFVQLDLKQKLKIERLERLNQQSINKSKLEFVSHISHEFRTPLTLILSDIESIKSSGNEDQSNHIDKIEKQTTRLKSLVNELMDFKKLEKDGLRIAVSQQNIVSFVKENLLLFKEIADKYNISLNFSAEKEELQTWFSSEQMEKILYNLISNALKFTESQGEINVAVDEIMDASGIPNVQITVSDTGIGIQEKHLSQIFENEFLTVPKNNKNFQSSGIGLYLTKKLVELHHGTIKVESEAGKGSKFIISLPIGNILFEENQILTDSPKLAPANLDYTKKSISKITEDSKVKEAVLIVEDNNSIRELISNKLSEQYHILTAKDGVEGIEIAKKGSPSLIITDLAMPKKNGLSLLKELKQNNQTKNIPVIVLTAFTSEEKQIQSLAFGADYYLSKPFSSEVLLGTVNNLIKSRTSIKEDLKEQEIDAKDIIHQLPDSELVKRTISILQNNLSNPEFSVDDLASALKVSRSHLYNKLGDLTNYSPKEFIHIMRVRHAAKLLRKGDLRINEVASLVGYYTPKNFRKYFKTYYGVSPSDYVKNH